jgi:ABC-2 type transport system permease protein
MRMLALLRKELADERQNLGLFVPSLIVAVVAILLPVFVAIVVPYATGERLSDSSDFEIAVELYRSQPGTRTLDPEAAIQAYLFQFFAVMLVLIPVTSSMSLAAYSVVGEKQARTLEPLLVTPITTFELLGAKVLGAFLPSIALTAVSYIVYVLMTVIFARPGVAGILLGARSIATVFVLGPLAALAALQMAVCVSSRVNDARTAQQIGVLVILPIPGLLVGQLLGALTLSVPVIASIALGLLAINAGLIWLAIALFDRETILTRWK